ncbi:hypothetical protein EV174_001023 [Coemansia sp. RSA 2320]|nr:hypothetical protein EV174_001023 [Coemansia sp. RSA 2320]
MVLAYVMVLAGVAGVTTPCVLAATGHAAAVAAYAGSWRQAITAAAGIVGAVAANVAGVRRVLWVGSAAGVACSAVLLAGAYGRAGASGVIAVLAVENAGRTIATVGAVAVLLTYPREQRKARALAAFQFAVNLSLTLGQVTVLAKRVDAHAAAWARVVCSVAAAGVATFVVPASAVVRDSGVYVDVARARGVWSEARLLAVGGWRVGLAATYVFAAPFALGTLGIALPDGASVALYNAGALGVVALGAALDVGAARRRVRGLVGLAISSAVVAACVIAMAVLRSVGRTQEPGNQAPLFYASVVLNGLAVSCVFLFSGWIIGSLTNDVAHTARLVGTHLHTMPALGSLAAAAALYHARGMDGKPPLAYPMYIGAALLAAASAGMVFVVNQITDTNNWSLPRVGGDEADVSTDLAELSAGSEHTTTVFADHSSISKHHAIYA